MNIEKVIQKLGYTQKEARLYLAALILGESKVSDLAEKLKIPRTSASVTAEKLHKEGLLTYYVKRFNKYWVAESPEKLLERIKEEEATLQSVLPELKALQQNTLLNKPTVKIYVGSRDIKFIFDDIILSKHNFRGIIAWNDLVKLFGNGYISDFIARQADHFLTFRLLTPESEGARLLKERDRNEARQTRFLSKHTASLNTATFIYDNKVAIISLNDTVPTGFLIEDINVHNTMAVFFEELWSSRA
jgi:sugar-specific transcriptional regulator TrmB